LNPGLVVDAEGLDPDQNAVMVFDWILDKFGAA